MLTTLHHAPAVVKVADLVATFPCLVVSALGPVRTAADLADDRLYDATVAAVESIDPDLAGWLASQADDEWGMDDATADRLAGEAEARRFHEAGLSIW